MRWFALTLAAGCPWVGKGDVDARIDADGDGFPAERFGGEDCDDGDAAVRPDADEVWYDGVDQDCSGGSDADQDRDGLDAASAGGADCDDTDPAVGAAEVRWRDADHDGYGDREAPVAACDPPPDTVGNDEDCDDTDRDTSPAGVEVCGGADEDCDGLADDADPGVDPGSFVEWYEDVDEDGFGSGVWVATACAGPPGSTIDATDCDDGDPARNPAASERCNAIDDDCDEAIDADDDSVDLAEAGWYADVDGDGGNADTVYLSCADVPSRSHVGGDCDDHDPGVSPGATEGCGGADEDCDGLVDEADPDLVATAWYTDADGDGWGAPPLVATSCAAVPDAATSDDDCDDGLIDVHPGAHELCDGRDDDCDGLTDDADADLVSGFWEDLDGDGWGGAPIEDCGPSDPAWAQLGGDCDEADPAVNPAALEVWYDGVDGDCSGDGDVDQDYDGLALVEDCDDTDPTRGGAEVWYDGVDQDCAGGSDFDQDQDGHDAPAVGGDDCDDVDPYAYPGAPESWYDDVDQDCLGGSDWDADLDGVDFVPRGPDCDDADPAVVDGGIVTMVVPGLYPSLEEAIAALACDGGVVELVAGVLDDPTFTQATVTRPVTIRGAGPGITIVVDGALVAESDLAVESLTLTGSVDYPIVSAGPAVVLTHVDCSGNDLGCVRSVDSVIVDDSTFSDNGAAVLQTSKVGKVYVSRSTFGPGDAVPLDLADATNVVLEDVAFVGEEVDGSVVSLTDPDATLRRVTWDGCAADDALLLLDGVGAFVGEDLAGTGNTVGGSAVATRGSGVHVDLDGLALVDTTTGLGPVVDVSGIVDTLWRVRIEGTSSSDAALAVFDQAQRPVDVRHLLIREHPGVGLRTASNVAVAHATIVGADVAVEQTNDDLVDLAACVLVGNRVAIQVGPSAPPAATSTFVYANDADVAPSTATVTGLVAVDPQLVTWDPSLDPALWDLHLRPTSPAVDAGDAWELDPDGTLADAGYYGGDVGEPWYYDDLDADGVPDGWEERWGAFVATDDLDGDRLDGLAEYRAGTSPVDADTDRDAIPDWQDGWPLDAGRF